MRNVLAPLALVSLAGLAAAEPPAPGAPLAPAPPAAAAPAPKPAPPLAPEQAAAAVLAAAQAKDAAAVQALAGKDDPDPWLVADELIRRGEHDVAERFATAAPRKDVARLPEALRAERKEAAQPEARAALAASEAALAKGDAEGAVSTAEGASARASSVVSIRLLMAAAAGHRAAGRAQPAAARWLAAAERAAAIGWLAGASRALFEAGNCYYLLSDAEGALSAWERRLAMDRERGTRAGTARALGSIAGVHYLRGDYAKALALLEEAGREQAAIGDRAGAAGTLSNRGVILRETGHVAEALEVFRRAQVEFAALGDEAGVARALANIGTAYNVLGLYGEAITSLSASLAKRESLGDRFGAAGTRVDLGMAYFNRGSYAKALGEYERALEDNEKLGNRSQVAGALRGIGSVHHLLGDWARALAFHERALREREVAGNRAGVVEQLGNLGAVYFGMKDYPKALDAFERTRVASLELGDRRRAADMRYDIGLLHLTQHELDAALDALRLARQESEAAGDRLGAARALVGVAEALRLKGDFAGALELATQALAESEALGAEALAADALTTMAFGQEWLGRSAEAVKTARRGVERNGRVYAGLGDEQGAVARSKLASLLDIAVQSAVNAQDVASTAFFVESGRAAVFLESFRSRDALRAELLPRPLLVAEADARAKVASAVKMLRRALDGGDRERARAFRRQMEQAQDELRAAVERLQRDAKAAGSLLFPQPASLVEIQASLAGDEALILYALTDTEAIAIVVTSTSSRVSVLGKSSDLEAACDALQAASLAASPAEAASVLRNLLVKPLALPDGIRRLLVSPDGALLLVPFAMLLPDRDVALVPSGTVYGQLLGGRRARGEAVLALGDPDYEAGASGLGDGSVRGGASLARLPETASEAKAIGDVVLLRKEASVAGLRRAIETRPRWRSVHFACHGRIDDSRPALSALALTADAEDDGFLTALDVFRIGIPADLVVLSACETAKGKLVKGEGLVGLTRAFMYAGAPRILCSLWKVDDLATRALMVKFYALWNPKDGSRPTGTAAALRAAQEYVRTYETEVPDVDASQREGRAVTKRVRPWEHPYYWAAWVLWGLPD